MSRTEHTPGPWEIVDNGAPHECRSMVAVHAPDRMETVCLISEWSRDQDLADARLIAAAPDLLAACDRAETILGAISTIVHERPGAMDAWVRAQVVSDALLPSLRAAIAKARGGQP